MDVFDAQKNSSKWLKRTYLNKNDLQSVKNLL